MRCVVYFCTFPSLNSSAQALDCESLVCATSQDIELVMTSKFKAVVDLLAAIGLKDG